jgi:hypothetical protein
MSDIFFFLRVMAITLVVVLLMQIRLGSSTIEDHALNFITSSTITKPIDDVAAGAVKLIRNTWSKFTRSINTSFSNAMRSDNQPGSRNLGLTMQRSQEYVKEKAAKTNESAHEIYREHEPQIEQAKDSGKSYYEKFKQQASRVSHKVRSKFIDETDVPGDANKASSTKDDEIIEE